jgi:hypothetical protein
VHRFTSSHPAENQHGDDAEDQHRQSSLPAWEFEHRFRRDTQENEEPDDRKIQLNGMSAVRRMADTPIGTDA